MMYAEERLMKKLLCILLSLCLLLSLWACGGEKEPQIPAEMDLSAYTLVVPQGNAQVKAAAEIIADAVKEATGLKMKPQSDKTSGEPDAVSETEILVGVTNRTASQRTPETAGSGGWWVQVSGTRIVVGAANVSQLRKAAAYFAESLTFEGEKITFATEKCRVESGTDLLREKAPALTVASFNIKRGSEVDYDMTRVAALIAQANPDIVGLQEVEVLSERTAGRDLVKELAEAAGYSHWQFVKTMDNRGGEYGTAILSRYPIVSFENLPLDIYEGDEPRTAGHFVLDVNGAEVDYYNTHFSYKYKEFIARQAEQMNEFAAEKGRRGLIITADFNTASLMSTLAVIEDTRLTNGGKYVTYASGKSAIDDIVMDLGWEIMESGVVESNGVSDHNLLWAKLSYTGGVA